MQIILLNNIIGQMSNILMIVSYKWVSIHFKAAWFTVDY